MKTETLGMSLLFVLLAFAFNFVLDRFLKDRAEKKQMARRLAAQKSIRETLDDPRPTMSETLEMELSSYRSIALPGDDETKRTIEIYARLGMENDLGLYADGPRAYDVDQAHRDILLAHARRDAAEALLTSQAVLQEVRAINRTITSLCRWLLIGISAYILWAWWKAAS